jgi:hypothetical protein
MSDITDKALNPMQHSFAAGSYTLRIAPNWLVRFKRHASEKMVYGVCGDYIEGLGVDFCSNPSVWRTNRFKCFIQQANIHRSNDKWIPQFTT